MNYELILALLVVSGLACILIAQNRHEPSPWVWGLIGLVLGPIGVLFTLVAAKGRALKTNDAPPLSGGQRRGG